MTQNNISKVSNAFLFDNLTKICRIKIGDTIETNKGKYKVKDFAQVCIMKNNTPYPGHCIFTETGEKIFSNDVINVVGVEYDDLALNHN